MKVRMSDRRERDLLLPPGRLVLVAFEESKELDELVLAEVLGEVFDKGIVVGLLFLRVVARLRGVEFRHVVHLLGRGKIDAPEPTTAAMSDLEFSNVREGESGGNGSVLRLEWIQGCAGRGRKRRNQCGWGFGRDEGDEAHGWSMVECVADGKLELESEVTAWRQKNAGLVEGVSAAAQDRAGRVVG